jgi:hypothetical protein
LISPELLTWLFVISLFQYSGQGGFARDSVYNEPEISGTTHQIQGQMEEWHQLTWNSWHAQEWRDGHDLTYTETTQKMPYYNGGKMHKKVGGKGTRKVNLIATITHMW